MPDSASNLKDVELSRSYAFLSSFTKYQGRIAKDDILTQLPKTQLMTSAAKKRASDSEVETKGRRGVRKHVPKAFLGLKTDTTAFILVPMSLAKF